MAIPYLGQARSALNSTAAVGTVTAVVTIVSSGPRVKEQQMYGWPGSAQRARCAAES
jgi:hypothetical protein